MRLRLRYHEPALADLRSIAAYTRREHGREQMGHYLNRLADRIEKLQERPLSGADASHLRPGLRKAKAGAHLIFYVVTPNEIEVVRILHQLMDADTRLR